MVNARNIIQSVPLNGSAVLSSKNYTKKWNEPFSIAVSIFVINLPIRSSQENGNGNGIIGLAWGRPRDAGSSRANEWLV